MVVVMLLFPGVSVVLSFFVSALGALMVMVAGMLSFLCVVFCCSPAGALLIVFPYWSVMVVSVCSSLLVTLIVVW